MPTEHISHQIEAYLVRQLPAEARREFESHLAVCPNCARELTEAKYLISQLRHTFENKLGQPVPPPYLRTHIQQKLYPPATARRWYFSRDFSGRVANAVGTLAVILLLAAGVFVTIQGRLLPTSSRETAGGGPQNSPQIEPTRSPEPTLAQSGTLTHTATASDSLKIPRKPVVQSIETVEPDRPSRITEPVELSVSVTAAPFGTIAFAAFNPADHRQLYELHLINADGSNHRLFPLEGVSEPALRSNVDGLLLAYRAWSKPTSPRSLLSSNLAGDMPRTIGGFWEDAQPDWSPVEDRLVFTSQRESDRRWRLYTSWGDGSAERDLRREGQSPSFAPDGHRFVFEGCDVAGTVCGLWQTTLDNSEQTAQLILADNLAKSPEWSPVNDQIVYMANPDNNWDLYIIDSGGSKPPRRLTSDPAIEGLPTWSPDGEWLAFVSDRDNHWSIRVMHVSSEYTQKIYDFGASGVTPPAGEPYGNRQWWDEQLSWSQ
jgi:hypothetical protein